jgi:hypothetical protein
MPDKQPLKKSLPGEPRGYWLSADDLVKTAVVAKGCGATLPGKHETATDKKACRSHRTCPPPTTIAVIAVAGMPRAGGKPKRRTYLYALTFKLRGWPSRNVNGAPKVQKTTGRKANVYRPVPLECRVRTDFVAPVKHIQ